MAKNEDQLVHIERDTFDELIDDLVNNQGMQKAYFLDANSLEILWDMIEDIIEEESTNMSSEREDGVLEVFMIVRENLANIIDLKVEAMSCEDFEEEMIAAINRGCTVVPPNGYIH